MTIKKEHKNLHDLISALSTTGFSFETILELENTVFYSLADLFALFREEQVDLSEQKAALSLILSTFLTATPEPSLFLVDSGVERCYIWLCRRGDHVSSMLLDSVFKKLKTKKLRENNEN